MRPAAVLIPPSLDAKQALRLRRFGLAASSYALATALVAVGWAFGMLPASVALEVAAAFLAVNLGLYLVIRSGFNLRFEDPSLTRFQILVAITVLMFIVYHLDDSRHIALFACSIVFLFGIFRLNAREFTVVTLYTLAAYALVINLLMHLRPQAIQDVPREWMSWLALAGFLPCFTIIGGHINTLRRKLHESEVRFRSLTEMSSDFYWESDAEHRLTQRASADKKLSTVSVFRQDGQIGERRWEIPYLSPDEAGWRAHRAVLDAHRSFRDFELSRLAADGTERHVSISGDPLFDAFGAFKGYLGVGKDITERKRAEQEIRDLNASLERRVAERTQQLEEANRAKSDFLANMSHELRTPLNSVIGFSEMLKDEVPGPLNARQAAFAADILASGEHLRKLVDGILEMSRLDALEGALDREPVEIGAALDERVTAHRRAAETRGVVMRLDVAPDAGRAELDPKALRRMLDALLDNAIKFNREGGTVAVSARRAGGALDIAVADTGIGIAHEDLEKLFKPLVQLDAGLARRHGGVGLGLALARRLAELHGGTIEVESEPGKGSTFTLRLPVKERS